jgi:hypothetical protein
MKNMSMERIILDVLHHFIWDAQSTQQPWDADF